MRSMFNFLCFNEKFQENFKRNLSLFLVFIIDCVCCASGHDIHQLQSQINQLDNPTDPQDVSHHHTTSPSPLSFTYTSIAKLCWLC